MLISMLTPLIALVVVIRMLIMLWCLTYSFCVSVAYLPVASCVRTGLLGVHRKLWYPVIKPSLLGQQSAFIYQGVGRAWQAFEAVLKATPAEIPADFVPIRLFSF